MSDDHPANQCHICEQPMAGYQPPEPGMPGIGVCDAHGVSYDITYKPPEAAR